MQELGKLGYAFQFVTLAGFHALNHSMFELAHAYAKRGMAAYSELQQLEFASESKGYEATRHQREVGPAICAQSGNIEIGFQSVKGHHDLAAVPPCVCQIQVLS